ncbi:MAG: MFS transporter [Pseudomonadota bacterium]|nr:MFS transporter [Pseudomonadota bacterium]
MAITAYRQLVTANKRLLGFGFVMALCSSFGQTFFIGIVGPEIQREFSLSHTLWGTIYMVGTLLSAALLPWTGALIDRFRLRSYALAACLLLIGACAYTASVSGTVSLILAIFLLRHAGQGLVSHISITTMTRYFNRERGRAIAVASVGFTAGEAVLPFLAVVLIGTVGWRWTYGSVAFLIGLTVIPTVLWLLRNHESAHRIHLARVAENEAGATDSRRSWRRSEVLRNRVFYLLMPGLLATSTIGTAMFFHHLNLADEKGWSHTWITGNYAVFAVATTGSLLLFGRLIDRFSAVRVAPAMLVPLILSMLSIALLDRAWSVILYMVLLGIQSGLYHTVTSALWAELYGVRHIGSIKSLYFSLSVLASALGPVLMGSLADLGMTLSTVCLYFAVYAVCAGLLLASTLRQWVHRDRDS